MIKNGGELQKTEKLQVILLLDNLMYPIRVPSKAAASSGLEIQESPISKNRPENDPYTVISTYYQHFNTLLMSVSVENFTWGGGAKDNHPISSSYLLIIIKIKLHVNRQGRQEPHCSSE